MRVGGAKEVKNLGTPACKLELETTEHVALVGLPRWIGKESPPVLKSVACIGQGVEPDTASRELLVRVDTALKLAKERGRNRLEVIEG